MFHSYMIKSLWLPVPTIAANVVESIHLYALQAGPEAASKVESFAQKEGTLITQLVILLTTIATLGFQIWSRSMDMRREARQRQWDLEDREEARRKTHSKIAEVKQEVREEVAAHTIESQRNTEVVKQEILAKVEENTAITAAAAEHAAAAATAATAAVSVAENRAEELRRMFMEGKEATNGRGAKDS